MRVRHWTLPSASAISPKSKFPPPARLLTARRCGRSRCGLRGGEITGNLVLSPNGVDHNLVKRRIFAAVELQWLVDVAVLLLVAAIVRVDHQREPALLLVGL